MMEMHDAIASELLAIEAIQIRTHDYLHGHPEFGLRFIVTTV